MIIGSETEYAAYTENIFTRHRIGKDIVSIMAQMDVAMFKRSLEGISTLEEHRKMDEQLEPITGLAEENELEDEPNASDEAMAQRRGNTGFVLSNGGRYYLDMSHPEYCPPETTNPADAAIAHIAGDLLVEQCRAKVEGEKGLPVYMYRNNSDGKGSSYGAHENYSLSPKLFLDIVKGRYPLDLVLNFFVTRTIVIGAGKVGHEDGKPVPYQISQRADFFYETLGPGTTSLRPIVNSRDFPYADLNISRRFHVICGDSNMSHLSLYLKFGITALFLQMLEEGFVQREGANTTLIMQNPVRSFRNVSRDLTLRHRIYFKDGSKLTALELQQEYCALAKKFLRLHSMDSVWHDVVDKWEKTLNGLAGDRHKDEWASCLDWVAKEKLILREREKKNLGPWDSRCRVIDLQYHDLNPRKSIFVRLREAGRLMTLFDDKDIHAACYDPPQDTRAWLRGQLVKRYSADISYIGWSSARMFNYHIQIEDPHSCTKEQLYHIFADDPSAMVFLRRIQEKELSGLKVVKESWL